MKYTALVLLAAFIITPLMLTGCDSLTLDDPKIVKLEARVAQLEEQITHWKAANTRLQNEKGDALDRLAMAVVVIKEQDHQIAVLDAKHKHAVDTIDAIMGVVDEVEKDIVNVEKASTWPPTKGDKISFEIAFDNNQLYNREDSREVARMIKAYSKATNGNIKITVEGYSSKAGSAKHNKALSLERAEGVMFKIYEASNSADPLNMEVIAHGETDDDERKVVVTVEVL